jgi:hypothetical protein
VVVNLSRSAGLRLQDVLLRGLLSPIPSRDLAALTGAHRDGWTASDVGLVGEWVAHATDDDARWLRERRHGWAAILSAGRARVRLDAARAWDARGRTHLTPTTTTGRRAGLALDDLYHDVPEVIDAV